MVGQLPNSIGLFVISLFVLLYMFYNSSFVLLYIVARSLFCEQLMLFVMLYGGITVGTGGQSYIPPPHHGVLVLQETQTTDIRFRVQFCYHCTILSPWLSFLYHCKCNICMADFELKFIYNMLLYLDHEY